MPYRYTLLAAALLLPSVAHAQLENFVPELEVLSPDELAIVYSDSVDFSIVEDIYGFTPDTVDIAGAAAIVALGTSFFVEEDTAGVNPDSSGFLGVGTQIPKGGVQANVGLATTANGDLLGCADEIGTNNITADLTGQIALIERGTCQFFRKARNAEVSGAVGFIVFNSAAPPSGNPLNGINMGGPFGATPPASAFADGPPVGIPGVFVPRPMGLALAEAIQNGETVSVDIRRFGAFNPATEPGTDPAVFGLAAAAPNPFTGRTTLRLTLAQPQEVRVEVFNALGQRVAILHEGMLTAGVAHPMTLDGSALPAGIYLVRATGAGAFAAQQVTLIR